MRIKTTLESMQRLNTELRATGLTFSRMWIRGSAEDGEVVLFNDKGEPDDALSADPRVAAVVAAHVPDAPIADPDYGSDAPPESFKPQAAQVVQQLRAYLAIRGTPTNVQTAGAVRLIARVVLFIVRRLLVPPPLPPLQRVVTLAELPPQMPGEDIAAEILAERERARQEQEAEVAAILQQRTEEQVDAVLFLVNLRRAAQRIVSEQIANNATIVTGRPGLSAYMTVAPNVSKGASANKQVGWRNCLQAIQEMARDSEGNGTPIYYDVVTTAGGMEFRTWIGQPGVDRRTTTSLSLENGTLRSAAWGFDRENAVTLVYGLGQEFSGARQQVLVADSSNIRSGFDVRETSIDARNATLTSELTDEASAELQRRKSKTFVSAEIANVQAAQYGVHWNYGDRVTVVVDGIGYGALIEGVQVQVDSNGVENVRATLRY